MALLSRETKKVFAVIHTEYEMQSPSIRGENDYTVALLGLQNRLLKGEDSGMIQKEFDALKATHPSG
ncbi:MAG: hypothetical protein HQM14_03290 [SAR324 cluster bacterium]|nr:hypothetical protein [SAR324 cluster bacterium]